MGTLRARRQRTVLATRVLWSGARWVGQARAAKEPAVLGHCANALVFIDQMVHNEGLQEMSEQVALFPEPQIKFVPLGSTVLPVPEKPYGELVELDIVSTATRAAEDLEKLQAKVAKANTVIAAAKATPK